MKNTSRPSDPLPEEFASEEEAAVFWNTHSLADYEECLEPVEVAVSLKRRHFEIEIDEESYLALQARARRERKPVKQLASQILKGGLAAP